MQPGTIALALAVGLVACKAESKIECGAGTVLRGTTCVVEAPPEPPGADALPAVTEPTCAELCKQLLACQPKDEWRAPLTPEGCAAACRESGLGAPVRWTISGPVEQPRPDCSKGCDDPACTEAFDWASLPQFVEPTKSDPVTYTLTHNGGAPARGAGRGWKLVATNRTKSFAKVSFLGSCANPGQMAPPIERQQRLYIEPGKTKYLVVSEAIYCRHLFVTVDSAKFDDGSIWRPWLGWTCKDGAIPCTGPKL